MYGESHYRMETFEILLILCAILYCIYKIRWIKREQANASIDMEELRNVLNESRWQQTFPNFLGYYSFDTTDLSKQLNKEKISKLMEDINNKSIRDVAKSKTIDEFTKTIEYPISNYPISRISDELFTLMSNCIASKEKQMLVIVRCCTNTECPEFKYRIYLLKHLCTLIQIPVPVYSRIVF